MSPCSSLVVLAICWSALYVQVTCKRLLQSSPWETVPVSTGAQLADALANPSVVLAELHSDIVLQHSDFVGHRLPIVVGRNFTVQGDISYRQLDLNYVYNKVRLEAGVMLTFRGLYILNARAKSFSFTPGLDLLVPTRPGNPATVLFVDGFHENGPCYPASSQGKVSDFARRPSSLPAGPQQALYNLPQPGCKNGSDVPRWDRCWRSRYLWIDLGVICFDLDLRDSAGATPESFDVRAFERAMRLVNYALWGLNETVLCQRVESEECMRQLGVVGCGWRMARDLPPMKPDPDPELLDPPTPAPVVVSGFKPAVVPLALGIAGGVVVLSILLGLMLLWKRQKLRGACWKRPTTTDEDAAAEALRSASCGGAHFATSAALTVSMAAVKGSGAGAVGVKAGLTMEDVGPTASSCCNVPSAEVLFENKQQDSPGVLESVYSTSSAVTALSPPRADLNLNVRLHPDCGSTPVVAAACTAEELPPRKLPDGDSGLLLPRSTGVTDGSSSSSSSRGTGGCSKGQGEDAVGYSADDELRLLGVVLGRGASGKVVLGEYQGQRVAVKMMELEGLGVAELEAAIRKHPGQEDGKEQQDRQEQQHVGSPPQQQGSRGGSIIADEDLQTGGPDFRTQHGLLEILLKAFHQEIEVLSRCRHPNVVRLLAACTTPPRLCLVMELAESNLARVLHGPPGEKEQLSPQATNRLLPLPKVLHIATEIARGLEYLHPTITHRDLKPANVLIFDGNTAKPHAKLADFGLSRLRSTVRITLNPEVGTAPYMAPECFDPTNFVLTHRADIYSFAVIMYEMLSGELPWPKATITEIAFNVTLKGKRPPLSSVSCDRCPRKLRKLVMQCWDRDPERRPAAAEVVKQLLLIQEMMNHCALANPEPGHAPAAQQGGSRPPGGRPDAADANAAERQLDDGQGPRKG